MSNLPTKAQLLANMTPVPAGTWVAVTVGQDVLGALNVLKPWPALATDWGAALTVWLGQPDAVGSYRIDSSFAHHSAVFNFAPTWDTTVSELTAGCDALSAQVAILNVEPQPGMLTDVQLDAILARNHTTFAQAASDPGGAARTLLSTLTLPVLLLALAAILFFLWDAGVLRRLGSARRAA